MRLIDPAEMVARYTGGEVAEIAFTAGRSLRLILVLREDDQVLRGPRLIVRNPTWRIDTEEGPVVAGHDHRDHVAGSINVLAGQRFTSVSIRPPSLDTTFVFGAYTLRIFPQSFHDPLEEVEGWLWTMSGGRVLCVGPEGRWAVRSREELM